MFNFRFIRAPCPLTLVEKTEDCLRGKAMNLPVATEVVFLTELFHQEMKQRQQKCERSLYFLLKRVKIPSISSYYFY